MISHRYIALGTNAEYSFPIGIALVPIEKCYIHLLI